MGYAAHRLWTTGTASLNPATVQLTKVWNGWRLAVFEMVELTFLVASKVQLYSPSSLD